MRAGVVVQVVVRAGDTLEELRGKVQAAAVIGTWQSTMAHWVEGGPGLRPHWRRNTLEERLLGVSMTGAPLLSQQWLEFVRYFVLGLGTVKRLSS